MVGRFHQWLCPLLLLALLGANPAPAQFGHGRTAGISGGLRVGRLSAATELADERNRQIRAFMRRGLYGRWQAELELGYGRLEGADYKTDMVLIEATALYSPVGNSRCYAYGFGGVGLADYDVVELPALQTAGVEALGLTYTVPLGAGLQLRFLKYLAVEVRGGYTFTVTDKLNGVVHRGNDGFWGLTVALAKVDPIGWGELKPRPEPEPEPEPEPPVEVVEEPVEIPPPPEPVLQDRDGDRLSDLAETELYFTNPVMSDSDRDGLDDGDEIEIHLTDPNRSDTDGGGVWDGNELAQGTDPLDAADDTPAESAPPAISARVFFPVDDARLGTDARQILGRVARALEENPELAVEVWGFSDNMGTAENNLALSQRRAETVRDYLVQKGIAPERLEVVARGEENPLAPNNTAEGRRKNRRVELVPRR